MIGTRAWTCFAALAITVPVGCADDPVGPGRRASALSSPSQADTEDALALWLEPMDLTTSVGDSDLVVAFRIPSGRVDVAESTAKELAAGIFLRTWPEGTDVAFSLLFRRPSDADEDRTRFGQVVLPLTPLSDRWYVFGIDRLPSGAAIAEGLRLLRSESGHIRARFRVGSQVVVSSVRVCGGPERRRIGVNLSEQLERSSDFRGFVRVRSMSGHDDVCRLLDGGVGDTCAATLWYDCGAMDEPFDFVLGAISGGESGLAAMDLQGQFGEQRYRVDFRGRTTGAEACDVVLVQGSPDGEEIVQALGGG